MAESTQVVIRRFAQVIDMLLQIQGMVTVKVLYHLKFGSYYLMSLPVIIFLTTILFSHTGLLLAVFSSCLHSNLL